MFGAGNVGVGDDHGIAVQLCAVRFEKYREVRAADLLFAFEDEREVAGQGSAGLEIGLDGFRCAKFWPLLSMAPRA